MKKRSRAYRNRRYHGKKRGMMPDTVDGVNVKRRFSGNSAEWDPHLTHFDPTSAPMPDVGFENDTGYRKPASAPMPDVGENDDMQKM